MTLFTDRQQQFMYNHKILSFIVFTLLILIVLAIFILVILALIYGPSVFNFSLWF